MIRQGCRRRIGDGKTIKVWHVPWLPSTDNGYVTSVMYPELADITVDTLINIEEQTCDAAIVNELCNDRDKQLIYRREVNQTRGFGY